MTLPTSGPISLADIRVELKKTGPITLNDPDVRKLAGKVTGPISLLDFYGKSDTISTFVITNVAVYSPYQPATSGGEYSTYSTPARPASTVLSLTHPDLVIGGVNAVSSYVQEISGVISFRVSGETLNSGWTKLTIRNNATGAILTLSRASASFVMGTILDGTYAAITGSVWSWPHSQWFTQASGISYTATLS